MWPFEGRPTRLGRHRVIHLWSTRWYDGDEPVSWSAGQDLRRAVRAHDGRSFGTAFDRGHLVKQYQRVEARIPRLAGTPAVAAVIYDAHDGGRVPAVGHSFLVRLASGHLIAGLNLEIQCPAAELPTVLLDALDRGPGAEIGRRDGRPVTLEGWAAEGARGLLPEDVPAGLSLHLTSEMHSMVIADPADDTLWRPSAAGTRTVDEAQVMRLVGRMHTGEAAVRDDSIRWPGEFNKRDDMIGAIRPGASLIAGGDHFSKINALISTLIQIGAASLLREARDEVYAVQAAVDEEIGSDRIFFDWKGRNALRDELGRLARVDIAVAFDVESLQDIRRVISDAKLVQWHGCLADALAIPASVTALHGMASHLGQAVRGVGDNSRASIAFAFSALAAVLAVVAIVVSAIVG